MSDSTKHFDAPRSSARLAGALVLARTRWNVLAALAIAAAIIGAVVLGVFLADRTARALITSALGSTSIVVQLDARTSAIDADALGPRIKALPDVSDATLTGRDEALTALIANGLPPPDGRNPLPDVWTVRLRPAVDGDARPWSTVVADVRRALAALPQVEATRVDERWIATVDAAAGGWATWRSLARPIIHLTLAVLLGCVGYLAGRAMVAGVVARPRVSVLALLGTTAVAIGLIIDALGSGIVGALLRPAPGSDIEAWIVGPLVDVAPPLVALALAFWVITVLAVVLGGRSGDSEKALHRVTSSHRNY